MEKLKNIFSSDNQEKTEETNIVDDVIYVYPFKPLIHCPIIKINFKNIKVMEELNFKLVYQSERLFVPVHSRCNLLIIGIY